MSRRTCGTFALSERFGLAVIAFRTFQMLLTPEDEQSCLAAVRDHLLPGGFLAINLFDPLLHLFAPGVERSREVSVRRTSDGRAIRVHVLGRELDLVGQTFAETWRFEELGPDGAVAEVQEEVLRMRWIYRWEMRYLLERQGFRVLAEYSDFRRSPPAYGKEQIWVAAAR